MEANLIDQTIAAIERELPENVARHRLEHYPSFPFKKGYMQNCDSDGTGVRRKLLIGRCIFYPRDSLLEWLRERIRVIS
jgi:hypothetical protein